MITLERNQLVQPELNDLPNELRPGDEVEITINDWYAGQHTLRGTVTVLYRHGRVRVRVSAGSEERDYSVPSTCLTLVSRRDAA